MRFRTLTVAAAIAAISATAVAQGPRVDGNWEIKTTMEIPGMPRAMPPTTTTQCITKEMAADPKSTVPQGPMPGRGRGTSDNCKMTDYKMDGNTATFTMKCDPPQQATMTGKFVYGVDSYEGTMKMDADRGGQPMSINIKYSGKRLGDCTK
jgi:Protein of unknown function (DUF3617)